MVPTWRWPWRIGSAAWRGRGDERASPSPPTLRFSPSLHREEAREPLHAGVAVDVGWSDHGGRIHPPLGRGETGYTLCRGGEGCPGAAEEGGGRGSSGTARRDRAGRVRCATCEQREVREMARGRGGARGKEGSLGLGIRVWVVAGRLSWRGCWRFAALCFLGRTSTVRCVGDGRLRSRPVVWSAWRRFLAADWSVFSRLNIQNLDLYVQ